MHKSEILALKELKGIGSVAISKVLNYMSDLGSVTLLDVHLPALINDTNLSRYKKILEANMNEKFLIGAIQRASEKINSWEKEGISVIAMNSDRYPKLLKLIKSPPELLFCKGNIELLSQNKNIALVGTRDNTDIGERIATKTTQLFASAGYVVVSGLATGIDTIAHEACINSESKTIAVLVDVDNIQPRKNKDLAARILKDGGLLVSENIPGISIKPPLFSQRDRIQAGLSLAVFAIETSIDGGTMHAVKTAKQEKRLVYVPDHTQSGYLDKEIKQIQGIISLSSDADVEPYTFDSYTKILQQLNKKESELFPISATQETLP